MAYAYHDDPNNILDVNERAPTQVPTVPAKSRGQATRIRVAERRADLSIRYSVDERLSPRWLRSPKSGDRRSGSRCRRERNGRRDIAAQPRRFTRQYRHVYASRHDRPNSYRKVRMVHPRDMTSADDPLDLGPLFDRKLGRFPAGSIGFRFCAFSGALVSGIHAAAFRILILRSVLRNSSFWAPR